MTRDLERIFSFLTPNARLYSPLGYKNSQPRQLDLSYDIDTVIHCKCKCIQKCPFTVGLPKPHEEVKLCTHNKWPQSLQLDYLRQQV